MVPMSPEKRGNWLADRSKPGLRGLSIHDLRLFYGRDLAPQQHSFPGTRDIGQSYGIGRPEQGQRGGGTDEVLLGENLGPDQPYLVRIYSLDGNFLNQWKAYYALF